MVRGERDSHYLIELGPLGYILVWVSRLGILVALLRTYKILKRAGKRGPAGAALSYAALTMMGNLLDHVWQSLFPWVMVAAPRSSRSVRLNRPWRCRLPCLRSAPRRRWTVPETELRRPMASSLRAGAAAWLAVQLAFWPAAFVGNEVGYLGQVRVLLSGHVRPDPTGTPGIWFPGDHGLVEVRFLPLVVAPLLRDKTRG